MGRGRLTPLIEQTKIRGLTGRREGGQAPETRRAEDEPLCFDQPVEETTAKSQQSNWSLV